MWFQLVNVRLTMLSPHQSPQGDSFGGEGTLPSQPARESYRFHEMTKALDVLLLFGWLKALVHNLRCGTRVSRMPEITHECRVSQRVLTHGGGAGVGIGGRPAVTSQWLNQEFDGAPTNSSGRRYAGSSSTWASGTNRYPRRASVSATAPKRSAFNVFE